MRTVLLALPALFFQAALADVNDQDTVCATIYTYLSESARASGVSSMGFDTGASRAQDNHLVQNPGDDPQRYALRIIDGAQSIRDGLARGTISNDGLINTATVCNNRYFAENQQNSVVR